MIHINHIADLLQTAGLGTIGQDIFYSSGPEGVEEYLLVLDNLEYTEIDENLPGYKKGRFRVVVRRKDFEDGKAKALQVMQALDLHRVTVGPVTFKRIRAECEPIPFPTPDTDIIEFSVNFWTAYNE